ncbi:hypothetical protein Nepgr_008080 [Nepenthes gracilis]|uniref:Uncharacterized protein n=1 Tax=Nepenthes gracilis TaxID=150966 RepID=A0AAD3XJ21_NEPGR|nr:hypothetical protein Nepgr_008080 [Nepenthes gracilis]
MAIDVMVDYQWRSRHHVNGRAATQKSTRKVLPAHQDVAPKNLFSGYTLEGRGTLSSMEGLNAIDNSQNVFLGKAVPLELAMPTKLAKEGPAGKASVNSAEQEANTNSCKTFIGPGVDGDLKDYVQRMDLHVRADEEGSVLSEQQLLDRMGLDTQLSPSDAELSSPDLNGEQGASESMGPVATSHTKNLSSTAFVDVVHRELVLYVTPYCIATVVAGDANWCYWLAASGSSRLVCWKTDDPAMMMGCDPDGPC